MGKKHWMIVPQLKSGASPSWWFVFVVFFFVRFTQVLISHPFRFAESARIDSKAQSRHRH
jgi:hypothetical protein